MVWKNVGHIFRKRDDILLKAQQVISFERKNEIRKDGALGHYLDEGKAPL